LLKIIGKDRKLESFTGINLVVRFSFGNAQSPTAIIPRVRGNERQTYTSVSIAISFITVAIPIAT